jgi:uncharacterized repeat protein (TIGR01451 family)
LAGLLKRASTQAFIAGAAALLCLFAAPKSGLAQQLSLPAVQVPISNQPSGRSVVIIDPSIGNLEPILAAARKSGAAVHLLTGEKDPIAEIADFAEAAGNVADVHILSHGSRDALIFDGKFFRSGDIEKHASDLARLGHAINAGGDILLYGCAVGGGGDDFLGRFAALTGRDVAASVNSTGTSAMGGDWNLEATAGAIETASLNFAEWPGLLVYATSTLDWTTAASLTLGTTASYTYNGSATALQFTIAGSGSIINDYTASFTGGTGDQTTLMQPASTSVTTGQTATMLFNASGFPDGIQTVTFDLRNIDASAGSWDDRLLVTAFDTNNVQLAGSNITATPRQISGQTYSVTTLAGGVQLDGNIDGTAGDNSPQDSVGLSITSSTGARIGRVVVLYTSGTAGTSTGVVGISDIGMTYNLPPSAKNDTIAFSTAAYTGNLFANNGAGVDVDGNGDTFSVTAVNAAAFTVGTPITVSGGTVTITNAATGAFTFTPSAAYGGSQTFTYTITDQYGLTSTATVTLTSPVTATADNFSASPIPGTGGTTATVYANDAFLGSAVTSANVTPTLVSNGGLTGAVLNSDGTITVPANSVAATYTLQYKICHVNLATNCATTTATIVVNTTAGFSVTKAQSSGPSPITAAAQTIGYTISIRNTGNVILNGLTISDSLTLGVAARTLTTGPVYTSGDTNSDGQIGIAETWVYSASYAVTQADVDAGGIFSNTATYDTAQTAPLASNAVSTPITQSPNLTISKTANKPGPLVKGDVVTFSYQITNSGNVTLSGVAVSETAFNGTGGTAALTPSGGAATLAPGASTTFTATYTVTQTDVDLL